MVSKNNYQFYQQKHADGKQRWGLRKLSVGVASVLLGTTFMLHSNHAVSADTVPTTTPTDATVQTDSNVADHQGSEVTLRTTADKEETVATTTNAEEKVVATNPKDAMQGQNPTQGQDTTQDKGKQTNANETTQNTTNVDKKDPEVTPTNDAKTPTTQNTTNVGNEVTPANGATTPATQQTTAKSKVLAARRLLVMKEASTSLPMSNQDIKLDSQPMLTEITNKPKDNWVYKNMKWYPKYSTGKVKEILQNHTTNDESGRYYFAGAANYNESYHVVYLLARSNNLNDNNLYVTILHTGTGNIQEEVVTPGESKKVEYSGTGGTTHAPIFTNYDGTSVSIDLDGVEKGDKNTYGMVVGFAYGYDTGIYGEPASMGNGFMTTPMPTKTTTTIHYIDQATGDEIAVPKSFEGVAYQKYTITGEAPTIDGYTLKQSPKTTGYISPYKVGESYDFRLDKHVVIKQTVIDSQGLVRVTAYYDGEAINDTTRYLGNIPDVNDHYSFFAPNGKSYTYINQITSTNDGIVYYYAKDGSEDKSEVRVHYIDVTGNKSSLFVPGDGKEVATDKISGKLGESYSYNVNLPTDYNLATNQANTVNGTYTIDHHDEYVYVVKKTSAEKITPNVPATKEPVANTSSLTETEKAKVQKNVEDANKGKFPEGTVVTVGDDGTATITYPDKSSETIPGSDLVRPATDAEKTTPKVPETKEPVANTSSLTETEKAKVQKNVEDANKGNFPDGTVVTVGDDGTATITYPDQTKSTDTIPGSDLVRPETDAEKITPNVPATKEPVANTSNLTETEKAKVQKNVEDANKGKFPEGTVVTVGDDGTATITYPDKSSETIPGSDLVRPATDAEKTTPKVPETKEPVANTSSLTETEKAKVQKNVEDANKGNFPEGTTVTVGDDGTATINYPDDSKDTIPGDKVVEGKSDADKNEPKEPGNKVKVDDPNKLTEDEKSEVVKAVEDVNKDENGKSTLLEGSKVTVGDNGDVTVTYPDGSKDTIPGDKVVEGKSDADKNEPKEPGDKVKVDDPNKLTDSEKSEVVKAVEDANKDENGKSTLPDGTTVTVGDNGDVTVTYPDGSKDTIPGDKVVEGKTTTDSENNEPKVPGDKVKVDDPNKLTEDEKSEVVKAVEDANKNENGKSTLPEGSKVTVGDNGDVTVTYPDGSKDTIPGDKVVEGKTTTDSENNEPKVPGDKVKVDDPNKLTEDEKSEVVKAVEDANKNENGKSTLPEGSKVTIGDNGDVTVTYPDGSKDTIPGDKVVEGKSDAKSDADKNEPKEPGDKVKVDDPNKLTEDEKSEVVKAVEDANKDENGKSTLPEGSKVTVGDNGDVTVTYPDGSKDTIPGDKVLEGKSDAKSDADKNEPKEPGDKVKVDDPNKLTDSEKEELSNNLEKLNPGTVVTIADDGTATLTYPDGSTNIIAGSQLVVSKDNVTSVVTVPTSANKIDKNNYSLGKKGINNSTNKLPQTGENNNSQKLSIIGMTLMGILGLFGLDRKKKKN